MYSHDRLQAAGLLVFRNFLRVIWDHLGLPEPTPVQDDMADKLQALVDSDEADRRIILEAFRGVGKSWITAAFVCWLLLLNPQYKILVVSANKDRANDFSIFVKRLINEVPILQHLRPNEDQRTSNIAFDVGPARPDQSPSVKSVGITGQLTGSRADWIIADDVEVVKNSYTHTQRQKLLELVKEFDAVLKPGGRVIYLGTPQTEASIYNKLPERGYKVIIWPARIPRNLDVYKGKLAQFIIDLISRGAKPWSPVDPLRFNHDDLNEREASYSTAGFELQFMLNTAPSDTEKHPLKLTDLMVTDLDPIKANVRYVWAREKQYVIEDLDSPGFDGDFFHKPGWKADEMTDYTGSVMFIDPSGKGKDETSWAVVKQLYGQLFLMKVGGEKDGFGEATLQKIAVDAAQYKVNHIIVEKNYGGGMFTALLQPVLFRVHKCQVEEVWHTGQKEIRILDVMRPVLNQHRLIVHRQVIEDDLKIEEPSYSLFFQMTRLTKDKGCLPHDDRLEAVSGAVQYWVESLRRDTEKAAEEHKAELKQQEILRFMRSMSSTGSSTVVNTYNPGRNEANPHMKWNSKVRR